MNVKYLAIVVITLACLVFTPAHAQAEVDQFVSKDRPDIGIVDPVPADKGDVIVVYSAKWCTWCVRQKAVALALRAQGYRVVIVDTDKPEAGVKLAAKTSKALARDVEAGVKSIKSWPTIRWYNTTTEKFVAQKEGLASHKTLVKYAWKP